MLIFQSFSAYRIILRYGEGAEEDDRRDDQDVVQHQDHTGVGVGQFSGWDPLLGNVIFKAIGTSREHKARENSEILAESISHLDCELRAVISKILHNCHGRKDSQVREGFFGV